MTIENRELEKLCPQVFDIIQSQINEKDVKELIKLFFINNKNNPKGFSEAEL